ncbi:heat shock 70 kDa protein 12B [Hemicordylus capensis]|uniref:heat shock 70 kDa protein 12B n=1 Tax=Hemicordylus capensis TaxID=884348 RepID=UPI002303D096|nr:heat shock 70 kDa protein 12B [Hemicordylus capensis]XP_053110137.1 heat shock 70 kDa protein 12B [Hemicordylus capensis]XP_053110138.1 heat shock 70 kDa protein 12B [Hemicordylus capensis]
MSTLVESTMHTLQIGTNSERSCTPSPPNSPGLHNESCSIAPLTPSHSPRNEIRSRQPGRFSVVVAIDFGTTSSGYAFSFASDPEAIHMMRKWEGGDPGVAHQKTPTSLLLTPEGTFHSFGYTARDYYHDLDPEEARDWMYFEKFKMKIHSTSDLTMKTELEAVNGKKVQALEVFAHALSYFKRQAIQELKDQCPALPEKDAIRWVITVPAIWKQPAKQFMREAAYLAGLVPPESPERLLIALEPEAASIYCRKLRLNQLIDLSYKPQANGPPSDLPIDSSFRQAREQLRRSRHSRTFLVESGVGELWSEMQAGDRYIVADCGGGTVDLTVHQIEQPQGTLKELYKASGGPYGAVGVDLAFERLLCQIFGEDFIATFKAKRPAAWVDLTIAFEARKRTAAPHRANPLNISLPFSFIDFYRKHRGQNVETALKRSSVNLVKWSSQGMLRMSPEAMNELFQPTISQIINHIDDLMRKPEVKGIKFLFLVGGFAESAMLQHAVQSAFSCACRVIIPQDVGLTILKGAVLFGLDPTIVRVRRSPLTYGVGVLNKFVEGKHPKEKLLVKEGKNWCTDIFEKFVSVDQSVALGEVVQRSYCPARAGQRKIIINIYCCTTDDVVYITDPGVRKCGTISLDLDELDASNSPKRSRREIRASMQFGDTEIKVTAMDVRTSKVVRASIDFLSN